MGEKGSKMTGHAKEMAARLVDDLAPLGDVTAKAMFGGFGIMESGVMFGLIDSAGTPHLRSGPDNAHRFEDAGATKHGRMPYWSVPAEILDDETLLLEWATAALGVARAAKK